MNVRLARFTRQSAQPTDSTEGFNRRFTAPLILGSLLNPVNSSMIAVSLVPIGVAFGAPPAETAWLVSALYLATAIGQPVIGRLVDTYGPRPLYLAGTGLVGVAGLLGAVAPSLTVLIIARVLLGLGTSAAYPAAMYLIRSENERTGRDSPAGILTMLAVAAQVTVVIGPTLGGLLIGLGGWRTIFTVNIPLAVACLVLGTRRLPRTPSLPQARERRSAGVRPAASVDIAGIALFTAMLLSLMLFLMTPQVGHWYLIAIAVAAAAALAVRELRVADPFLDLRVLAGNVPMLATFLRQVLNSTAVYAFLYGYTQWLEDDRGLGPSVAGLLLLPMSLVAVIVATLTGRRPQIRGKLLVGGVCLTAAYAVLLFAQPGTATWLLVAIAVLVGIPQGLNGLANQNALYRQADRARMGSAAGLLRTFTYLGAIASSAAVAAFFTNGAHTDGLHHLALFILACAVLLLAVTVLDRSLRGSGTRSEAGATT